MATYAIGDVQGCYAELRRLLSLIGFNASRDCLWFVGDLVNRGPQSLEVLRYVESLGNAARVVLGNHDLHLLATSRGVRKLKGKDTFDDVLNARDRKRVLGWLREQPLLYRDTTLGFTMVHAGLAPQWSVPEADALAGEVAAALNSRDWVGYFEHMYADTPERWRTSLTGYDRLRFITNALTRLRYCRADGSLAIAVKETPPGDPELTPWYAVPERRSRVERIVFGHWATLQSDARLVEHNVFHVDWGCVWGGRLAALVIEERCFRSIDAQRVYARP